MNAGYKTVKSKLLVAALTLLMVFGNVASPLAGAFNVYAAGAAEVSTWKDLAQKIEDGKTSIDVIADLYAENTIEIAGNVEIASSNGSAIYQKEKDSELYDTMFAVKEGGTLTLGEGITLSGKRVSQNCDDQEKEIKTVYSWERQDITAFYGEMAKEYPKGEEWEENVGENPNVKRRLKGKYIVIAEGDYVSYLNTDTSELNYSTDVFKSESITDFDGTAVGYTALNEKYQDTAKYELHDFKDVNKEFKLKASDGKNLGFEGTTAVNLRGKHVGTRDQDQERDWMVEVESDTGKTVIYSYVAGAWPRWDDFNDGYDTISVHNKADNRQANITIYMCYEYEIATKHEETKCPEISAVYSNEQFKSGTADNPRGFFVQVENGGKFDLNGAELKEFTTPTDETKGDANPTPFWVAPVAVNGGEFTLTDGSINNNRVGYTIANDDREGDVFKSGNIKVTKEWIKKLPLNNCAGAIIFANGATGNLNGGSIDHNMGASGAMIITGAGTEVNLNDGAKVNNNVGLLFAGAALVDNGATLNMYDGAQMSNNITWNKGGAVWVSDWGTNGFVSKDWSTKPPKVTNPKTRQDNPGTLNMYGGTLDGNTALVRGGAINVESDNVHLYGGTISDNKCYSLGGAIYVEGDSADYSYILHIREGYIGENNAYNDGMSGPKDSDFKNFYGDGGGVWLCPIGGTGALTIDDSNKVVINNNEAENKSTSHGGQDVYLIRGNGSLIVSALGSHTWQNEATKSEVVKGKSYSGPVALTNLADEAVKHPEGIQITGNKARDGGGIAANGTVIFGEPEDIYKQEASINFIKKWSHELNPVKTKFRVKYSNGKNEVILDEFELDGKEDPTDSDDSESKLITEKAATDDNYTWNASISIPTTYTDSTGAQQALFKYIDPTDESQVIDPSTTEGLKKLCKLNDTERKALKVAPGSWKFAIEELDASGNVSKDYIITSEDVVVDSLTIKPNASSTTTTYAGQEFTVSVNYATVQFGQAMNNDAEPAIEKYVNQAVHKDIKVDEVFTYDIMAYVPMDADKVIITDELVDDLEFVSKESEITVLDMGGKNNHKTVNNIAGEAIEGNGDATVAADGKLVEGAKVAITKDEETGKETLKVTVENKLVKLTGENESGYKNAEVEQYATPIRGHWVKVTFQAQIKKALQDLIKSGAMSVKDLKNVQIAENQPVLSDEAHGGVDNTATLKVEVKNEHNADYDKTSNTVTVKPEEVVVEHPAKIKFPVHKTVKNGDISEYESGFEFVIKRTSPDEAEEHGFTDKEGNLVFENLDLLTFHEAGEYKFTISEVQGDRDDVKYDDKVVEIVVTVVKSGTDNNVVYVIEKVLVDDIKVNDEEDLPQIDFENEKKFPVEISKTDLGGAELKDAEMILKNASGEEIHSWISSASGPKKLKLTEGTYELVEEVAPAGYKKVTTKMTFSVDSEGKVTLEEVKENDKVVFCLEEGTTNHVILKDAPEKDAEVEKYVNDKVHEDIVNFDQVFTYDVLAYVPLGATKAEIKDELVKDLIFAGNDGDATVTMLKGDYDANDHKVNGAVKYAETEDFDESDSPDAPSVSGRTITVELSEGKGIKSAQGRWVKLTFKAQIDPDAYPEVIKKLNGDESSKVDWLKIEKAENNKPVENNDGDKADKNYDNHEGIRNKAGYTVEFDNNGSSSYETNEVTIKPETVELTVEKKWNVGGDTNWPANTSVTFKVYKNDEAIREVKLDKENQSVKITDLPRLKDVKYRASEFSVTKDGKTELVGAKEAGETIIGAIHYIVEMAESVLNEESGAGTYTATNTVKVDVDFSKTDLGGEELEGAEMELYAGYNSDDSEIGDLVEDWTSDKTAHSISKLTPGKYTLIEKLAPTGYETVTTEMVFTVNGDGTVTLDTAEVNNGGKISAEGNHVVLADAPTKPEVEKYVNKAVHKYIGLDEVFTYDIIGKISMDADCIVFEDELVEDLEFANEDVEVVALDENNHKPLNNIDGEPVNKDASVAASGTAVEGAVVEISGQKLTVTIDDKVTVKDGKVIERESENAKNLRGKYVKVTFKAQIKKELRDAIKAGTKTLADLSSVKVDENGNVLSDEAHEGIKNDATLKISVANEGKYSVESNVVTVKPELPEIEKYVNQAVHKDVELDETFTYDVIAYVTKDASKVVIKDTLNEDLQFVSTEADVTVADMGTDDNHKVTNNIKSEQINKDATVAADGTAIDAQVSIDGQDLVVTIADAKAYRTHWIRVRFDAKIADGRKLTDLKYTAIKADEAEDRDAPNIGNAPVVSDEDHTGIPNKAGYSIYVNNNASVSTEGEDTPDDNPDDTPQEPKYEDESNTVTVKPAEHEVEISKNELGGSEIPGATITVKGENGFEETWVSGDKPHVIKVPAGEYTMTEVVAPEGFQRVTTEMVFKVDKDGNVELVTVEVDGGGKISVDPDKPNHLILEDSPEKEDEFVGEVDEDDGDVQDAWIDQEEVNESETQTQPPATVKGVKTGDESALYIWVMTLMVTLCTVALAVLVRARSAR